MGFPNPPSMDFLRGEIPRTLSKPIVDMLANSNICTNANLEVNYDSRLIHRVTIELLKNLSATLSITKSIAEKSGQLEDYKANLHDTLEKIPLGIRARRRRSPLTTEEFEENMKSYQSEISRQQRGILYIHKEFIDDLYQHLASQRRLLYEARKCLRNCNTLLNNQYEYCFLIDVNPYEIQELEFFLPYLYTQIQMLQGNMPQAIQTFLSQGSYPLHKGSVVLTKDGKIKVKKISKEFKELLLSTMTESDMIKRDEKAKQKIIT